MKKYIAALLLFMVSCSPVYADRLDMLEAAPNVDYCTISADQFLAGLKSQSAGHGRKIVEATPDIMARAQHGLPLPRESMYVPGWNTLTEREQGFVKKNVFSGWDESSKIGRPVMEEEAMMMAQTMFNNCMYERTKNKRMSFIKTDVLDEISVDLDKLAAAIDGAVNPKAKRYFQCKEWLSDHAFIGRAVKAGQDCPQMIEWTNTSDVNMVRKEKVLRLLKEACSAPDVQVWFDGYYNECMGEFK